MQNVMVLSFTPLCVPVTPDSATSERPKFPDLGNFRQSWGTVHVICRENQEPGRSLIQLFLDKTIFQIPIHKGARHCQDGRGPFSRGAAAEFTEPVKADSPATGGVYVGRVRTDSRR